MASPVGQDVDVAGYTYTVWADAPKQGQYHAFRVSAVNGERVWAIIGKRKGRWAWLATSAETERPVSPPAVNEPPGGVLKEYGMALALMPETLEEWKEEFTKAATWLASGHETFTSEDVLDLVGLPSGTIKSNANNAVGAMMNGLARRGVIGKTGERRPSQRPSSHGAELTVWAGLRASETREPDSPPYRGDYGDPAEQRDTNPGCPFHDHDGFSNTCTCPPADPAKTREFFGVDSADDRPFG